MEFNLTYNRKAFEEILYANNEGSYTKSTLTKRPFYYFIITCVIICGMIFLPKIHPDLNPFSFTIILGASFFVIHYIIQFFKQHKKRRNVNNYLDNLESHQNFKILVTEDTYCVKMDDNEYCEQWGDIVRREDHALFLYLVSKTETYFVPKKSIQADDLAQLIAFLDTKILPTTI